MMSHDSYLTPTRDEAASLRLHLAGWDDLDAWPRSVSVAIHRGAHSMDELVAVLHATDAEVEHGLRPLLGRGLLYDGGSRRYLLR